VPDGFFAVRRCQFHYSERTCCFDIITPSRVFRMQAPEGRQQLLEWTECYKQVCPAAPRMTPRMTPARPCAWR
jgi:hypothetical protein